MTEYQAIQKARRLSAQRRQTIYVIWDGDEYQIASDYDLATYYADTHDNDVVYCANA